MQLFFAKNFTMYDEGFGTNDGEFFVGMKWINS